MSDNGQNKEDEVLKRMLKTPPQKNEHKKSGEEENAEPKPRH